MKLSPFISYCLAAALLAGCAGLNQAEKAELARQYQELKASVDENNARIEDLNNKFMLIHEKLEDTRADMDKLHAVSAVPPEGLEVVDLGEAARVAEAAPKAKRTGPLPKPSAEAGPVAMKAAAEAKDAPAPARPPQDKKGLPEALYARGQDFFITGRLAEARKTFTEFLKAYPGHDLADNALYWLGESYYSEKNYSRALSYFRDAAEKYPDGNKAPDALLKAGFSYFEIDNGAKAKESLNAVMEKYPGTDAAQKAKKAVERLTE